jgi:hypothetical protein
MKSLIKLAVGAAIAGALVNMLMKQQRRSGRGMSGSGQRSGQGMSGSEWLEDTPGRAQAGSQSGGGFTVGELVADTNTVHSGDAEQDQRGRQPQDWRGAQNVQDS